MSVPATVLVRLTFGSTVQSSTSTVWPLPGRNSRARGARCRDIMIGIWTRLRLVHNDIQAAILYLRGH